MRGRFELLRKANEAKKAMKRNVVNPRLPGRYGRMTAAELDAEVAMFDQDMIIDRAKSLTRAQWAQERRARRKGARAENHSAAKRIVIKIDSRLLRRADAWARKHGTTRADVFALGLRTVLARTG
jgi:hypothetical protein